MQSGGCLPRAVYRDIPCRRNVHDDGELRCLNKEIGFTDIPETIENVLNDYEENTPAFNGEIRAEDVLNADSRAREKARELIEKKS